MVQGPGGSARHGLIALALVLASSSASSQVTWHVDASAPPGGDGSSWPTAFGDLQAALDVVQPFDSIWVAAGTYLPSQAIAPFDARSPTFQVGQAVELYGGFDGTETSLSERAGLFDQTILSGDLGVPLDPSDNAYHVVNVEHPMGLPAGPALLDGFTIRDGNAIGPAGHDPRGGGLLMFNLGLGLRNVTFQDNQAPNGGAIFAQPAGLRLARCRFLGNRALGNGGAIAGLSLSVYAFDCTFAGNHAGNGGGAVRLSSIPNAGWVAFESCSFHDNRADKGGALFLPGGQFSSGKAILSDCTLAFNRAATEGGALGATLQTQSVAAFRLRNCIVWNNTAPVGSQIHARASVEYCNLEEGGWVGQGNLSLPPLFVDAAARDLRLAPGSPCIDAGSNALVFQDVFDLDGDGNVFEPCPFDLDGERRFVDDPLAPNTGSGAPAVVDMGAYEH